MNNNEQSNYYRLLNKDRFFKSILKVPSNYKNKLACGVLIAASIASPIFSEVFFTDRAKETPAAVEKVMQAWNELNQAEPENVANVWLKKPGEPGYIGDISVDFDAEFLKNYKAAAVLNGSTLVTYPDKSEKIYASDIAHETEHAWANHRLEPSLFNVLTPFYATLDYMLYEAYAHLNEIPTLERKNSYKEVLSMMDIDVKPQLTNGDPQAFYFTLKKYNEHANPTLSANEIRLMTNNEFIIEFVQYRGYLTDIIESFDARKKFSFDEINGKKYFQIVSSLVRNLLLKKTLEVLKYHAAFIINSRCFARTISLI